MNVNDVRIAAEDLVEANNANPLEGVHVKGIHDAERIDGFDVVETDGFTDVFVLDSRGEPAVSSRVVERKDAEIKRLKSVVREVIADNIYHETDEEFDEIYQRYLYGGDDEWSVKRI